MGDLCPIDYGLLDVLVGSVDDRPLQAAAVHASVGARWLRDRVRLVGLTPCFTHAHRPRNSTVATLVFAESYDGTQAWQSIETVALVVGFITMVLFAVSYLVTQAPFPVLVFGGYFGSTIAVSILLLAAPTIGSPCTRTALALILIMAMPTDSPLGQQLITEAAAFVVAFGLLLVCNR